MKRLLGPLAAALLLTGIMIGSACSNQGEGEHCEVANGNNDCNTSDDLLCYEAKQLNNSDSDRCCPRDRTKATHPVCKIQSQFDDSTDGSVTPPPDAAPDADGTDDLDASSDGSSDGSEDANPVDGSDQ